MTSWFIDCSNHTPEMHATPTMQLDPSFDEPGVNSTDSGSTDDLQGSSDKEDDDNKIEGRDHANSFQGTYNIFLLTSVNSWIFILWLGINNDKMNSLLGYFGSRGSMYEDTQVMDMLEGELIDRPHLERLLLSIEETWMKEVGFPEEADSQHHM